MYDNIGKKIKSLAVWTFIFEAIGSIITGFIVDWDGLNFLICLIGPIVAWVSSWLIYGFGELIDKTCDIERNTRGGARKSEARSKDDSERISRIEKLRSQGLITEEEYQQAISKQ